jgi:hypothetical protein
MLKHQALIKKTAWVAMILVMAVVIVMYARAWGQLPPDKPIPIHYGADGHPNGYASKIAFTLLGPGFALFLDATLLFTIWGMSLGLSGRVRMNAATSVEMVQRMIPRFYIILILAQIFLLYVNIDLISGALRWTRVP